MRRRSRKQLGEPSGQRGGRHCGVPWRPGLLPYRSGRWGRCIQRGRGNGVAADVAVTEPPSNRIETRKRGRLGQMKVSVRNVGGDL